MFIFLLLYPVPLSNNDFISRYVFLYRIIFSVMNYFMFFFHVIIGFFDSISRIFLGAGIGILTVARIDRSLLPRGYEHLDNGKIISMTNTGVYEGNDHLHIFLLFFRVTLFLIHFGFKSGGQYSFVLVAETG